MRFESERSWAPRRNASTSLHQRVPTKAHDSASFEPPQSRSMRILAGRRRVRPIARDRSGRVLQLRRECVLGRKSSRLGPSINARPRRLPHAVVFVPNRINPAPMKLTRDLCRSTAPACVRGPNSHALWLCIPTRQRSTKSHRLGAEIMVSRSGIATDHIGTSHPSVSCDRQREIRTPRNSDASIRAVGSNLGR
jgi:hypothetical protein